MLATKVVATSPGRTRFSPFVFGTLNFLSSKPFIGGGVIASTTFGTRFPAYESFDSFPAVAEHNYDFNTHPEPKATYESGSHLALTWKDRVGGTSLVGSRVYGRTINTGFGPTGPRRSYGTFIHKEDPEYETTKFPEFDNRTAGTPEDGNKVFTYVFVGAGGALGAVATKSILVNLGELLSPPGDVLAAGVLEVDLSSIPEGKTVIVKWRGKPVFIRHRPSEEIAECNTVNLSELRDPQSDSDRVKKPEWLVLIGICTHLGCIPIGESGEYNGWFCPCHGSHYDKSGRIRKGPAPLNLEIPPYEFISDSSIVLGNE